MNTATDTEGEGAHLVSTLPSVFLTEPTGRRTWMITHPRSKERGCHLEGIPSPVTIDNYHIAYLKDTIE